MFCIRFALSLQKLLLGKLKINIVRMKKLAVIIVTLFCTLTAGAAEILPGVSRSLAIERKSAVDNLCYDLNFKIPALRKAHVSGRAVITFTYRKCGEDLQLDFQGADGQYGGTVLVNGRERGSADFPGWSTN